jgi:hypothetical protein
MTESTTHVFDVPAPEVIRVANVSKRFTVRKDSSLKERVVTLGRAGRQHRQDFWGLSDVSLGISAGTTITPPPTPITLITALWLYASISSNISCPPLEPLVARLRRRDRHWG